MSSDTSKTALIEVIRTMKEAMDNDLVWQQFSQWGENAENAMYQQAKSDGITDIAGVATEIVTLATPAVFRKKGEENADKWMGGYQFHIQHIHIDTNEVELKSYKDWCFLAFDVDESTDLSTSELGKNCFISEFFNKDQIEESAPVNQTH